MIHRYIIEATDEVKGFEEAIERLDREWGIEEQEPCEDAISRQAVMDCFKKWQPYMATRLWDFEQELSALPSVKSQEPKTGHWTRVTDKTRHLVWECGCGWQQRFYTNFCPDCGAKMESEVEK